MDYTEVTVVPMDASKRPARVQRTVILDLDLDRQIEDAMFLHRQKNIAAFLRKLLILGLASLAGSARVAEDEI